MTFVDEDLRKLARDRVRKRRDFGAHVVAYIVVNAMVVGMALGGWMSGVIFDLSGSYRAAFFNGIIWNLLNIAIMLWLLLRSQRLFAPA